MSETIFAESVLKSELPGSDHKTSLNKHLSGSPAVVRNRITERFDHVMALSALNGADRLILTRAFFQ